jgi:hypothetical protein
MQKKKADVTSDKDKADKPFPSYWFGHKSCAADALCKGERNTHPPGFLLVLFKTTYR